MPGKQQPLGTLYVCNLSPAERAFLRKVYAGAKAAGYTRIVEPMCCGTFAFLHLAREEGYSSDVFEAGDVHLFSALMAARAASLPLSSLGIVCHADYAGLDETVAVAVANEDAATVLWAQFALRIMAQKMNPYTREILENVLLRQGEYVASIQAQLDRVDATVGGMTYRAESVYATLDRCLDDPRALIAFNATCYKGGYEKFYDTAGMLEWAGPDYELFDPIVDKRRIMELADGAQALLIQYDEAEAGEQAGPAVMVTPNRRKGDRLVTNGYLVTNRPDEVLSYAEPVVDRKHGPAYEPLPYPQFTPADAGRLTEHTTVSVVPVKIGQASYYRALWTHKFVGGQADENYALLLGGKLAGVFGYTTYFTSVNTSFQDALLLTYGMAPAIPGLRLNRLLTLIGASRTLVNLTLSAMRAAWVQRIVTTQMTRYPESKEMRGLMKLAERHEDPTHGYKLVYERAVGEYALQDALKLFLAMEKAYQGKKETAGVR
jgi:hypothetical protein